MRLLLIEDNLENAQFFTLVFNTAGYEVVHRTHGLEGLKVARQETFDAILIDFDLPDIDGSQICLALRKTFKSLPIIALTAQADKITRNKARSFGFDAFISKPCTDIDLINTVQLLTRRVNHTENPEIQSEN
jgi:DNA-binding response OmpR family regulator